MYLCTQCWVSVSLKCPFLIVTSVFSNVYLSCIFVPNGGWVCLWNVHSWYPLRFSLTFICPVSLYPMLPVFLDCPFLIATSVFSNVYLSCDLCPMLPVSPDCPFLIATSVFSNVYLSCDLCPMLSVSPDCLFLIATSIFSNVYLSCDLCPMCQFLWIVHS